MHGCDPFIVDQCKSHGQKFLKSHPHEKERLLTEHRKMMQLRHQQIQQPQQKKATLKHSSVVGKVYNKKLPSNNFATKPDDQSDIVSNVQYNNEGQPIDEGGGNTQTKNTTKPPVKFAIDSIDIICKDIHERNNGEGLSNNEVQNEKTSCSTEGPEFQQPGVEELLSLSVAVSTSVDEECAAVVNNGNVQY